MPDTEHMRAYKEAYAVASIAFPGIDSESDDPFV
jgi:hypothetical protein